MAVSCFRGLVGGFGRWNLKAAELFSSPQGLFSTSCLRERELMGWQRPRPVPLLELVAPHAWICKGLGEASLYLEKNTA